MAILAEATQSNPFATALWPMLLLAMTVAAALGLGLFRRRAIVGPVRLGDDEPVDGLTAAMIAGYFVWFGGPLLVLIFQYHGHLPTTAPTTQTAIDAPSLLLDLLIRLAVVVIIVAIVSATRPQPRRLGIAPVQILPGLLRALLGILFVAPLMLLVLVATDQLWKLLHWDGTFVHDSLRQLGDSHNLRLRAMLLASILIAAPISEELFFRGCMQTLVVTWLGRFFGGSTSAWVRWGGVVLISLLFAWAHPWWSRPPIFVLALCLGYAYERTGNLWTAIGLHALFNGAEVFLYFQTMG